ncbi:MAG: glycosyltransferase [Bacteroidia bacterium]|nr:glycosyltransferase family 2 protein [Bacteroidales bacterium]NCD42448.1 glycosyltransferase [Bacteroidia bacterium]
MASQPDLSVVIPCYNESANLRVLYDELCSVLPESVSSYEILFIDDGSHDETFSIIQSLHSSDPHVRGISLSRNFGHQVALAAGLQYSTGKAVITMDGDLQHPPALIPELYRRYKQGYFVVNTKRLDTADAGYLKTVTSRFFYRWMNRLSDVQLIRGGADFRLMSREAVEAYNHFQERDRFNRGLITWMGFRQDVVEYKAQARYGGATKYTVRKMLRFAIDGVTSFSSKPLRIAAWSGILVSLAGVFYAIYALFRYFAGNTIQGWTSLLITVLLLGGVQLLSLGIIGEYIARIFNESKARPLFFIKDKTDRPDFNRNE